MDCARIFIVENQGHAGAGGHGDFVLVERQATRRNVYGNGLAGAAAGGTSGVWLLFTSSTENVCVPGATPDQV